MLSDASPCPVRTQPCPPSLYPFLSYHLPSLPLASPLPLVPSPTFLLLLAASSRFSTPLIRPTPRLAIHTMPSTGPAPFQTKTLPPPNSPCSFESSQRRLAFHPLDGIIQALPHVLSLFLVPTHFTTHLLLLFAEGIWTTNIHDNLHGNVLFIMGAKYHTIHHTTYRHNYGHYTVLFDWLFGTLHSPEEYEEERRRVKGKAKVVEGEEESREGKKVK
ncbi:unnamed protein product [Closterium sp. NIES-64]|nr:unnamed protein product [Closterium sp. NIES-64]